MNFRVLTYGFCKMGFVKRCGLGVVQLSGLGTSVGDNQVDIELAATSSDNFDYETAGSDRSGVGVATHR
jgi:hypothetical protein